MTTTGEYLDYETHEEGSRALKEAVENTEEWCRNNPGAVYIRFPVRRGHGMEWWNPLALGAGKKQYADRLSRLMAGHGPRRFDVTTRGQNMQHDLERNIGPSYGGASEVPPDWAAMQRPTPERPKNEPVMEKGELENRVDEIYSTVYRIRQKEGWLHEILRRLGADIPPKGELSPEDSTETGSTAILPRMQDVKRELDRHEDNMNMLLDALNKAI